MHSQVLGMQNFLPSAQEVVLAPNMSHLVKLSLPNIFIVEKRPTQIYRFSEM